MSDWKEVTRSEPCPSCGKLDWCAWTPTGDGLRCMRHGDTPAGMKQGKADAKGGTMFYKDDRADHRQPIRPPRSKPKPQSSDKAFDLAETLKRLQEQLIPDRLEELAGSTGVPAEAWAKLKPGWCEQSDLRAMHAGGAGWSDAYPDGAFAFPEHDGKGKLVGLSLRTVDGRKGAPSREATGCKRGLIVPAGLHEATSTNRPVLVLEGASDVAACNAMGIPAVGRPSNRAGASDVADLLDGVDGGVLVVGERDGKDGGAWPGRDGAKATAEQIAGRWGEPVQWTLPPEGAKDLREWYTKNPKTDAGELIESMTNAAREIKPSKRSMADALVELAEGLYRFGKMPDHETFVVEHSGPNVAVMLQGGSKALRARLAKSYREATGKTPNSTALGDALVAIEGIASDAEPEQVALRLARHETDAGDGVVLDLGDEDGHAAIIDPQGVTIEADSPVLFRRTALTGAIPTPDIGCNEYGALAELRQLLNVSDETWPLVVGWLVACLIPDMPHPVLMLGGEQGTGKSTAARLMVGLVDPSPALLRSEPKDPEAWAMSAAGSWCVTIDNVSKIMPWWSDAICKAVTGDGWIRRKLYHDSDLSVLSFQRCVTLTSIDAGALRGDLADRLLLVDLEPISKAQRMSERDLNERYRELQPRLMAGLLWALSRTLEALPDVVIDELPRMADFARVLAALDVGCPDLTGGQAFENYMGQRDRIAEDVIESDAVAVAIVEFVDDRGGDWCGTAGDLYNGITPTPKPRDWPTGARGLSGHLKRIKPALAAVGITVIKPEARTNRGQLYTLQRVDPEQASGLTQPLESGQMPSA